MGKILDAWSGATVMHKGRKYFEIDGLLVPEEEAVIRMQTIMERLRQRTSVLRSLFRPDSKPRIPMKFQPAMGVQGWEEMLDATIVDGATISNTLTETIVAPDFSIPAFWMIPGRVLRLWAFGVNSNVVTTPGTLTFRVRWGGVGGIVLLASAAQGLDSAAAHTNALWALQAYIVCRAVGSGTSGSFMSGGQVAVFNLLTTTAANLLPALLGSAGAPGASGNVAVGVDTTTAKLLSITAQEGVTTNPTNLTCQQRIIEALN